MAASKPYVVKDVNGASHTFATIEAAILVAASYAANSWTSPSWTVLDRTRPDQRVVVYPNGLAVTYLNEKTV